MKINWKKLIMVTLMAFGMLANQNMVAWSLLDSNFDEEAGYWIGWLQSDVPREDLNAEDAARLYLVPSHSFGLIHVLDDNGGRVLFTYSREDFFEAPHEEPGPGPLALSVFHN